MTHPDVRARAHATVPRAVRGPGPALALGAAAAMAATAVTLAMRARAAERRHPPTGRFLTVDSVRVHYEDRGAGPAVVLVHGNGTIAHDWAIAGVTGRLARAHRVIAIDRPGYGYSERPRDRVWSAQAQARLLRDVLERLGVEEAVIVGHSWGAIVAAAMGVEAPEACRALVLVSGYYFPTARSDVWLLSPPAIPVVGDVLRYTVSGLLARALAPKIVAKSFAPRPVPERFREDFPLELSLRPSQLRASAADSALMVPSAADLEEHYDELAMPVAIMTGAQDRIVTPHRQAERLHRAIPHSTLQAFAGVGHMVQYAAPDAIAQTVADLAAPQARPRPDVRPHERMRAL